MDLATIGIGADTSALDRAEREMRGLGRTGGKVERDLNRSTKSMAAGFSGVQKAVVAASTALAAIGAYRGFMTVVGDIREFEQSLSNLSAITGAVGDDLEYLSDQAKDIGQTTTLSASQAVTAFKLIASAKPDLLESGEALNAVTREAVLLAEAAGVELSEAASTVGTSLNQFGEGAESASRFVNVLAAGAKFGASEIAQTSLALKNSGSAANAAGVSFEETNAAIQALAAGGIRAAEAGTGLRNVLLILEQEQNENLRPSVVGLGQAIENLADKQLGLTELTEIFGRENAVAAQTLVDQSDNLSALIPKLTGTATATEQAARNFDNLDGDARRAGSATEALTIALGERLNPAFRSAVQGYTSVVSSLADLIAESDDAEEKTRLLRDAMKEAGVTASEEYAPSLDETVESLKRYIQGEVVANEVINHTGQSITNNAELMQRINALFGEGARQAQRYADISGGLIDTTDLLGDSTSETIEKTADLWELTDQFTESLEAHRESIEQSTEAQSRQTAVREIAIDNAQGVIRELERELQLRKMSARERQVAEEIERAGLGTTLEEAAAIREAVYALHDYDEAKSDAAGSSETLTRAVEETTEAMRAQERMFENIQRGWGDLFTNMELTVDGFVDTVVSQFARMRGEMMSADMMNAVFNGGGMDAILSGQTSQGLGNLSGMVSSIPGIGGAAGDALSNIGFGGEELAGPTRDGAGLFKGADLKSLGLNIGAGMAGNFAGGELGEAIFGKKAESAIGATIGGVIGSFGGPLGSFIGSTIGSAIDVAAGGDGKERMNAGFLGAVTPGTDLSRTFDVEAFASGFDPTGFARRTDQDAAREVINIFRNVDENTKELADKLGIALDTSRATLGGFNEEAAPGSAGTFFGLGGNGELTGDIGAQVNRFVEQLVDHMQGLSGELEDSLQAAETADEVFAILRAEVERQDEAANDATGAIAGLTQAEQRLMRERMGATSELLDEMASIQSMRDSMSMQMSELMGATPLFEIEQTVADQVRHIEDQRQQLLRNHRDEIRAEERLHEQRMRTAQGLDDFLFGLQTGDQSALGGGAQLELAQERFRSLLADAQGGDATAAGRLSGAAQSYIDEARAMFASSADFKEIFAEVTTGVQAVEDAVRPQSEFDPSAANDRLVDELNALDQQLAGIYSSISDRVVDQLSEINVNLMDLSDSMRGELVGAIGEFVQSSPTGDAMLDALGGIEGSIDVLPGGIASAMSSILGNWAQQLHSSGSSPDDIASQVPSGSIAEDALNDYLNQTGQGMVIGGQHVNYNPGDTVTQAAIQDVYAAATGAGMTSAELADQLGFSQEDILQAAASAGLPSFSGGGVANGPQSGYLSVMHGPEAVVPLDGGAIPVNINRGGSDGALLQEIKGLREDGRAMREQMSQLVRIAMTDGELSAEQRERMTTLLSDIDSKQQRSSGVGSARYANAA